MTYQKGQSGNPAGRPKGAKGKRAQIPPEVTADALKRLAELVASGDPQAIKLVLDRTVPALKPTTAPGTLDAELLELKIREMAEFEDRITALENAATDGANNR